ncbi:MAG TPA: prepilin-type N-terminal cleavage/methylation domain-containing protein [Gammaproteobacteria bacterium]|nr:prepilin-type N-terminal cleavage/methylation domain-containing protein [Gammaproteobacteria bacterium]
MDFIAFSCKGFLCYALGFIEVMRQQNIGFTMIELVITLVIAAILSAIVTPSFRTMVMNNSIVAQTNSLVSAFHVARSEAAKRDVTVGVVALESSDNDNEWGKGWKIWVDTNNDGNFTAGEEVIKEFMSSDEQSRLDSTNDISVVRYSAEGFLIPMMPMVLEVCDSRVGEKGRTVTLSPSGRVKTDHALVCS